MFHSYYSNRSSILFTALSLYRKYICGHLVERFKEKYKNLHFTAMSSSFRGNSDGRIYVGNLPPDIRSRDIEDLFYKFGKIVFIDLKNRRGPPFAFVEFDDPR